VATLVLIETFVGEFVSFGGFLKRKFLRLELKDNLKNFQLVLLKNSN
jgi:hypothetical protein